MLAAAGNCQGCHTTPEGPAWAGGVPIPTPFGTIYGSNITPDAETGIGRSFLRTSALRSLGAYFNVFTIESFMDELALAARADPVDFRLRHLDDPRAREVIRTAADRFGWQARRPAAGRGKGFAFARYKNLAAYAAIALEAEVRRDTGEVRVLEVVAAVDCGKAVNADGIANQIEGGIVQSTSWTTVEEVTFDPVRITSRDWGGYPILRFGQVPTRIEVRIIDRPGTPFLGIGEASQGPTSAAIANAVAAATGARSRSAAGQDESAHAAAGVNVIAHLRGTAAPARSLQHLFNADRALRQLARRALTPWRQRPLRGPYLADQAIAIGIRRLRAISRDGDLARCNGAKHSI